MAWKRAVPGGQSGTTATFSFVELEANRLCDHSIAGIGNFVGAPGQLGNRRSFVVTADDLIEGFIANGATAAALATVILQWNPRLPQSW